MRVNLRWIAAALAAAWALPALAADNWTTAPISPVSYADRLDQVEAQLASLRTQSGGGCADCGDSCGEGSGSCSSCCACVVPSGPYVEYELVVARPYLPQPLVVVSDDQSTSDEYTNVPFEIDHRASSRISLGYVGCSGLGGRARYWQFDQAGDPISFDMEDGEVAAVGGVDWGGWSRMDGEVDVNFGLELHAVDLEVTQAFSFCRATAVLSAGVRYARVVQDYDVLYEEVEGGCYNILIDHVFDGYGPTVALELHRPIGCRGLALYGSFRGSVLFGDVGWNVVDREYDQIGGPLVDNDTLAYRADNVAGVLEAQLGVELVRQLPRGANLLLRLGYEGQVWDGVGSPSNPLGGPPLGFEGYVFDLGVSR
jgi:hypothetical protein